jgi:hypothetical protein
MGSIEAIIERINYLDNEIKKIIDNFCEGNMSYADAMINKFYLDSYLKEYDNYRKVVKTRLVSDINSKALNRK